MFKDDRIGTGQVWLKKTSIGITRNGINNNGTIPKNTTPLALQQQVVSPFPELHQYSKHTSPLLLQQYQSAIRAHKAGRAVNFEELPVPHGEFCHVFLVECNLHVIIIISSTQLFYNWYFPVLSPGCDFLYKSCRWPKEWIQNVAFSCNASPITDEFYSSGFPPIPGQKATGAEQGFIAALEAADKLSSTDDAEIGNEEEDEEKEEEVSSASHNMFVRNGLLMRCFVFVAVQACSSRGAEEAPAGRPPRRARKEKDSVSFAWPNRRQGRTVTIGSVRKRKRVLKQVTEVSLNSVAMKIMRRYSRDSNFEAVHVEFCDVRWNEDTEIIKTLHAKLKLLASAGGLSLLVFISN